MVFVIDGNRNLYNHDGVCVCLCAFVTVHLQADLILGMKVKEAD